MNDSNSSISPATPATPVPASTDPIRSADAILIETMRHDLTLHFMRDSSRLAEFQATVSAAVECDERNDTNEQQIVILTRWYKLLIPASRRLSNCGPLTREDKKLRSLMATGRAR